MSKARICDVALVGAGLANGLIALRLAERRPDLDIRLYEAGEAPGGNHTWSFHEHDLDPADGPLVEPLVAHRWPAYEVRFPRRRRTVSTGYRSATAERFRTVLAARLPGRVETGWRATELTPTSVAFANGETVRASCVIDGRGPGATAHMALRHQKFLGREFELERPHGLAHPIVMDATVAQADGYRFVYVLPLTPTRLLVEDTYYADGPALDPSILRARVDAYREAAGWGGGAMVREEQGVLPIALGGDMAAFWAARNGVPASGLAAGLFHPTTGYSLPDAARLATRLAALPDLSAGAVFSTTRDHSIETFEARRFFRMLNKMLFLAGDPARRFEVLQHFHRLSDPLIARFYAARLTPADKLRILSGRPPVPVGAALRALLSRPGQGVPA
ncbi:lycopene beta-cyclase CrtY [Aurantimonas sp. Leaf443]|uniref:lycopene beta-cyclase CrtY n=1 Tax=Aurantimonas sp. Leaf443 TaxID=1736378 RepID=UPI0006F406C4|nr:lycopene beta-cyclase CrtY [Aurantimonas sp. Leaf443]KQT88008.1 lycopene cyclase [Aurantimonas sp. Leaf443]